MFASDNQTEHESHLLCFMKISENSYYHETTRKEICWEGWVKIIYFVHELEHHVCFRQIMVENGVTLLFTSWMMCVQAKQEIEVEKFGACRVGHAVHGRQTIKVH